MKENNFQIRSTSGLSLISYVQALRGSKQKKSQSGGSPLPQDWLIGHPSLKRAQKTNPMEFSLAFVYITIDIYYGG